MSSSSKTCAIFLVISSLLFATLIQAYDEQSWEKSLPEEPSWEKSLPEEPSWEKSLPEESSWKRYLPTFRPKTLDAASFGDFQDKAKDFTNNVGGQMSEILAAADPKTMNVIDACWRKNPNWAQNRQQLADCAKGFGSGALGGKGGPIYVVTDDSDDPVNPKAGTLRHGLVQEGPLWIIFQRNMRIKLKNELLVSSFKTIDGRGADVQIGFGAPCLTLDHATHVIIHGITIGDCVPGYPGMVRVSPNFVGHRGSDTAGSSDGDAISLLTSTKVWIDHCHLSKAADGLIDVTLASTAVTISNNLFTEHDKVILLGHDDKYTADKVIEATVAFNHFGPGCIERMPRVRFGYAHVANNRYTKWGMYAIGGSAGPTILSEGNYFMASDGPYTKQVTKRDVYHGDAWKKWKWQSSRDWFMNGAYFVPSGAPGNISPAYTNYQAFPVANGGSVPSLTADAGPLRCVPGRAC